MGRRKKTKGYLTITEVAKRANMTVPEVRTRLSDAGLYSKVTVSYSYISTRPNNTQWRPTRKADLEKRIAKKISDHGGHNTVYAWYWPYIKKVLNVEE